MTARLEVRNASKNFGVVRALDNVSLSVEPGEIHALLGENGAGKSTLGKIVSGVYFADSGTIFLDGKQVDIVNEAQAGRLGIGIVHQEGSLVPQLSVAENIFAGRQPTKFRSQIDWQRMRADAAALLEQLGVKIDPGGLVSSLAPAQCQIVEIAKALSRDLRLLILDEPTAALTLSETDYLFAMIRRLAASGVSVVYVSHRLKEIFDLCQKVTILKDGKLSGRRDIESTTPDDLIRLMVGRDVYFQREAAKRSVGVIVLEARNVAVPPFVRDASLSVRAGEIVCLAGLIGSGRTEFCEAIFGARKKDSGLIELHGKALEPGGPWDAIAASIGMAPEDRKDGGLFLSMDIAANISITVLDQVSSRGRMSRQKAELLADRFVKELRITTPSVRQLVGNLSGGNQQKVLLAKWLALNPKLLIVDEPTRGVDIGARAEIYRIIRQLAGSGMAIIVVSSDLPEVLALADRIIVMAEGWTVGELVGEGATEEDVLRLATIRIHGDALEAA